MRVDSAEGDEFEGGELRRRDLRGCVRESPRGLYAVPRGWSPCPDGCGARRVLSCCLLGGDPLLVAACRVAGSHVVGGPRGR